VKVAVVVFPGTNCDHDVEHVFGNQLGARVHSVWHRERDLGDPDVVVLPGGFSYGDYLRTGALAKLSPAMESVRAYAQAGGRVVGICNGFQILCEAGLLPGVLLENVGRRFLSRFIHMRVDKSHSFFTAGVNEGQVLTCPIAHFQGNYFADPSTLDELERNNQVVFRYSTAEGELRNDDIDVNVNGSCRSIAGICSKDGRIVGLMPHPERATERLIGSVGGESGLVPFRAAMSSSVS